MCKDSNIITNIQIGFSGFVLCFCFVQLPNTKAMLWKLYWGYVNVHSSIPLECCTEIPSEK